MCRGLGNNIQTGNLPSVKEIICITFWKEKSDPGTKSWEKKRKKTHFMYFSSFWKEFYWRYQIIFFSPSKETPDEKQKQ